MTTDVGSFETSKSSKERTTPVSQRVSPTLKIRAQIDALFDGSRELVEIIEEVARLGAQLIIQTAVEAEVTEFLGRARYQRVAAGEVANAGSRNGYCPTTVKTTAGPVTVARPKLRGTTELFTSRLFGTGITKSNALEALVIAAFVRGLSVRDVEATLIDALGVEATLSKSEVSRICQAIRDELAAWGTRRLDDLELDYLFLDGSHFKYHVGAAAEPVLAAWGITTDGKPVLVGLGAAGSESGDAWADFLTDLGERGLACPLLVISDGAPGLIGAVEQTMGAALRQRCLIHRSRNLLAKVPTHAQADVKADYWAIFDVGDDIEPGLDAVTYVQRRIDAFARRWRDSYPAAVRCLLTDRDSLTVYLRFPREHWTRTRHSNFIERTFGETRRRVKVIGRLPGETSCMSLVWAVLDRASRGWRGFTMTPAGLRLLQDLRRQLLQPPTPLRPPARPATEQPETVDATA
jgi:putative transposase